MHFHLTLMLDGMDHSGRTPLHLAVKNGHIECAKILLEMGAKTTASDSGGCYPIHLASQYTRNSKCVKLLLAKGSSQDISYTLLTRCYTCAYCRKFVDNVKVATRDSLGRSPLHHAAEVGSVKAAKALLEAGASASPSDNFHHTPLHYSKLNNHEDVSNLLASRGAGIPFLSAS